MFHLGHLQSIQLRNATYYVGIIYIFTPHSQKLIENDPKMLSA